MPLLTDDQIRALQSQVEHLPRTAPERGHQARQLVDAICSACDEAGAYYISQYRPLICAAVCDVLYGNAAVDVPSWK